MTGNVGIKTNLLAVLHNPVLVGSGGVYLVKALVSLGIGNRYGGCRGENGSSSPAVNLNLGVGVMVGGRYPVVVPRSAGH